MLPLGFPGVVVTLVVYGPFEVSLPISPFFLSEVGFLGGCLACFLFFAFVFAPEGLGLELVPIAVNVFEPVNLLDIYT